MNTSPGICIVEHDPRIWCGRDSCPFKQIAIDFEKQLEWNKEYSSTRIESVKTKIDGTLPIRAKKIFRSRMYDPKRSVRDRYMTKRGRKPKLKQVQVTEQ